LPDEKNVIYHVNQPISNENGEGQRKRKKRARDGGRKKDLAVQADLYFNCSAVSSLRRKRRFPQSSS